MCVLLKGRRWEEEKEWERKEQLVPGRRGGRGWKGQIQAELAVRDSRIIITTGGATVEGRKYALGHLGVHQLSIKKGPIRRQYEAKMADSQKLQANQLLSPAIPCKSFYINVFYVF